LRIAALLLSVGLFLSPAWGQEKASPSKEKLLHAHHQLFHELLMVVKDQIVLTQKSQNSKLSITEKAAIKRKTAQLANEIDEMIRTHDDLMNVLKKPPQGDTPDFNSAPTQDPKN